MPANFREPAKKKPAYCSCVPSRDGKPAHNSKQTTNYPLFHGSRTKTPFSGETWVSGTLNKNTLLFDIRSTIPRIACLMGSFLYTDILFINIYL